MINTVRRRALVQNLGTLHPDAQEAGREGERGGES